MRDEVMRDEMMRDEMMRDEKLKIHSAVTENFRRASNNFQFSTFN